MTDGAEGYRVVRLLEAAQKSINEAGREIELGPESVVLRQFAPAPARK